MDVKMPQNGLVGGLWNAVVGPSAGVTSSEFAGSAAVGTIVAHLPIKDETKAWILASLAAVYTVIRGIHKVVDLWKGRPGANLTAGGEKPLPPSSAASALLLAGALGLGLSGCASGLAGSATAPAAGDGRLRDVIVQTTIIGVPGAIGPDGKLLPPTVSVLITNSGSGTTTPSSQGATATPTNTVSPQATVPLTGGAGLPISLGGGGRGAEPPKPSPGPPAEPPK
jgi:hypothetical protein